MDTDQPSAGPQPGPSSATRRARSRVGVTVICLLAGLLFGTSASLAREDPTGAPSDLPELITARDGQVRELTRQAETLGQEVEELRDARASSQTGQVLGAADTIAPAVGLSAVRGPAIAVTLDDAGYTQDTLPEGYSVDDVVVHQQDLQGVINALWAGGAEAIMVQDQRIIATSSVQCVGNTLYLEGRVYSPPYTVTAIGDPEALHAALEADPVVQTYRDWSSAVGLGYQVDDLGETELPAFVGSVRPQHARILQTDDD
ncbi:DUF881 domain-containing protein [Ornithinimicrobium sufpigmenti]|uniref:DUF881 domain-containing protein n=1 Tax=Ornithinimicrobium sufpigmenti TaxID=2508882 RepID=UPI001036EE99|nr:MULTISPECIES: DUF881 domain-containing protein [unclassified Ornithinimicrobium]